MDLSPPSEGISKYHLTQLLYKNYIKTSLYCNSVTNCILVGAAYHQFLSSILKSKSVCIFYQTQGNSPLYIYNFYEEYKFHLCDKSIGHLVLKTENET